MRLLQGRLFKPLYEGDTFTKEVLDQAVKDAVTEATKNNKNILDTAVKEASDGKIGEIRKLTDEIAAIRSKTTITGDDREELEQKVSQLEDKMKTDKELQASTSDKLSKKHAKELSDVTGERDYFKDKYNDEIINRSITDGATVNEGINPAHFRAMLRGDTQLVKELDSDNNETGKLVPEVSFAAKDKEDKPITLKLSPNEAIKRMKDMPEHSHLFKGQGVGGTGGTNVGGGANGEKISSNELAAKDPEKYMELRLKGEISLED